MKVKVADLEPNPFRKMERYPISREKIEALKISIGETSFWDNILARPHPTEKGKYQIAYGHHRFVALRELGLKQVDIPIRELGNPIMVKIMAEENLNWTTTPAVINETVLAAKDFLDVELTKYEYKDSPESIRVLFESKHAYNQTKNKGVGQPTLLKFLGGNWKKYMIDDALDTLRRDERPVEEGGIDRKAIEMLPTQRRAKAFKAEVIRHKIPKPTQRKIAREIKEKDIGALSIPKVVFKHVALQTEDKDPEIAELQKLVEDIDSQSRTLYNKIMSLRQKMKELNVEQLRGVKVWLAASSLKQLFKELKRLEGKESQ